MTEHLMVVNGLVGVHKMKYFDIRTFCWQVGEYTVTE